MCAEARRCDSVNCSHWRWKQTADANGETRCLCGRPFTRTEWRRLGERRGAAKAKAKAKPTQATAKAKAKAKAKAQAARPGAGPRQGQAPRPWAKPQGGTGTGSPTGRSSASAYELSPELAARVAQDDVLLAEEHLRWCKSVGRSEAIKEAEKVLRRVREERDEALPPRDRLTRLRSQRDEAEQELADKEREVAVTEQQVYDLECELHQQRDAVVGVRARLETLDRVIEQVELQIPPEGWTPATDVTPKAVTQQLMQVQHSLLQLQGGDLPVDVFANMQYCLRVLDSYGATLDQARREREAQEAADARLARALAEKEAQEASAATEDVDLTGDDDFTEVLYRGRAKKGKGNGKGWRGDTTSPTVQPLDRRPDIGPLATLGRMPPTPPPPPGRESRAASEPRGRGQERRRSPRRQAAGTPAQPGAEAAGVLGDPQPHATVTGPPTDAAIQAGRPAEPQDAAPAATPPGAEPPAGLGQPGAGVESPRGLNPGGRPPLT